MSGVFIKILNLSLSASWLILAVILLRALLKKAPKWFPCALWAIVAIRLILPFSFESATSLIPSSEPIPAGFVSMENPKVESGITYINEMINPAIAKAVSPSDNTADAASAAAVNAGSNVDDSADKSSVPTMTLSKPDIDENIYSSDTKIAVTIKQDEESAEATAEAAAKQAAMQAGSSMEASKKSGISMRLIFTVAGLIWSSGAVIILGYALFSALRLKNRIAASIEVEDGVFMCDEVKSPFIFGIFRPRIYVPSSMQGKTLSYVLAHERSHLARRDNWWKPLGFLLLAVYWFNPLSWVAYILLCRDIEMACDEKVIRDLEKPRAAEYSQALLDCSLKTRTLSACPLAFGEVGVKQRVKNVLNYRKPRYLFVGVLVVLCGVVTGCFLTNPKKKKETTLTEPEQESSREEEPLVSEHTDPTFNFPVEVKGDTSFTVSGLMTYEYKVDVKNAYFDGTTVIVDYDLTWAENMDPQKVKEGLSFSGSGFGKLGGHDIMTEFYVEPVILDPSENTMRYRVTGVQQSPTDRVQIELRDTTVDKKFSIELERNPDAEIYVLTSGKPDQGDFKEKVTYETDKTLLSDPDEMTIDRVIVTESGAYIFWDQSEFYQERISQPIEFMEISDLTGTYHSLYEMFPREYTIITTSLGYIDTEDIPDDGTWVTYFRFDDSSKEDILKAFRNAKYRLKDEELQERKRIRDNVVDFTEPVTFNYPGFSILVKSATFDGHNLECIYDVSFQEVPNQNPLSYYSCDCIASFTEHFYDDSREGERGFPTRPELIEQIDEKTFTYKLSGSIDTEFDYVDVTIQDNNGDDHFTFCVKNSAQAVHVFRPESFDGPKNDEYVYHTISVESEDDRFILYEIVLENDWCDVYFTCKDEAGFDVLDAYDFSCLFEMELNPDDAMYKYSKNGYMPIGELFFLGGGGFSTPLPDSVTTKCEMYSGSHENVSKLFRDPVDETEMDVLVERLENAHFRLRAKEEDSLPEDPTQFKAEVSKTVDYNPNGKTSCAFDGYTVEITKISFNGSLVEMEYDMVFDDSTAMGVASGFEIIGTEKEPIDEHYLNKVIYTKLLHFDSEFVERADEKTHKYTARATCEPADLVELSLRDTNTKMEYIINVKRDASSKVYVFRAESDTRPKKDNVEYLPLPEWECDDENFVLNEIIVMENECFVCYGYKTIPDEVNTFAYNVYDALQTPMDADDPDLLNPEMSEWKDGKKPLSAYFEGGGGGTGLTRQKEGDLALTSSTYIGIRDHGQAYDGIITQEYAVEKIKNMFLVMRTEEEYRCGVVIYE